MKIPSRSIEKITSVQVCNSIVNTININKYIIELLFAEPIEGYDRCPLCSTLVNQNKWREHLMGDHPCVNNPRNKLGKSCKYLILFNYLLNISIMHQ